MAYTVTTRVEEDNTNAIETYVAATDGAAPPRRITHDGRSVASPRWTDDNLLEYTLNARVNSAVFVGGDRAAGTAGTGRAIQESRLDARRCTPVHLSHLVAPAAPGVIEFRRQVARAGEGLARVRRRRK